MRSIATSALGSRSITGPMSRGVPLALAVMVVLGSTCTEDNHEAGSTGLSADTANGAGTLDCANPIAEDAALPETYEVIGEAVALPTSTSSPAALQTAPSGAELRLFAKTRLLLTAGMQFNLTARGDWKDRAAGWWGNTSRRELATTFSGGPCDGSGWLAYPGGFFVAEPGCVPFDVLVGGAAHEVQIGVGSPCPGQDPPEEPTAD